MDMLTIGQMGELNRVTAKAIRVYEQKGLLTPSEVNEETGWRRYALEQSTKLDLILELQQVGFTLDEIVEIDREAEVSHLRDALAARREAIERQINDLTIAKTVVDSYLTGCDQYLCQPVLDQIMLEMLPERRVLMFELPPDLRDAERDNPCAASFEAILRFTRQSVIDGGYPPVLYRDVCSRFNTEGLARLGDPSVPLVTHTFVFTGDADLPGTTVVPAGAYLTLYNSSAYGQDGDSLSRARVERMMDYAGKKGLAVEGFSFGETICRWPRLFDDAATVLHRLCVPVSSDGHAARRPS